MSVADGGCERVRARVQVCILNFGALTWGSHLCFYFVI